MIITVLTLFPEMLEGPLGVSIMKKAQEKGFLEIEYINIRDFADNKHGQADDYPFGGGAGMVMMPQPIFDSCQYAVQKRRTFKKPRIIYVTPKGKIFNQQMAEELSKEDHMIILCGHYEGIDQRVIDTLVTDEISVGDYVLTGGEIPAAVIIDAVARLIPGVLCREESYKEESLYSGLLEYPHYTRPRSFRGIDVPEILLSGNHKEIAKWRRRASLEITFYRRPELLEKACLTDEDKEFIHSLNIYQDKP